MPNRLTRGSALVGAVVAETVTGEHVFTNIQPAVAKPGALAADDKDTEARAAIDDIIDALIAVGIIEAPGA